MISIYKVSTFAIVTMISTAMLVSVSSVASAGELQSAATNASVQTTEVQAGAVQVKGKITRAEARRIVNAHLKDNGKRNLRAGRSSSTETHWIIKIKSPSGVDAGAMRVDRVSGELSKG